MIFVAWLNMKQHNLKTKSLGAPLTKKREERKESVVTVNVMDSDGILPQGHVRSEEHTSELQSR